MASVEAPSRNGIDLHELLDSPPSRFTTADAASELTNVSNGDFGTYRNELAGTNNPLFERIRAIEAYFMIDRQCLPSTIPLTKKEAALLEELHALCTRPGPSLGQRIGTFCAATAAKVGGVFKSPSPSPETARS